MFFLASKIVHFLFMPLTWVLLLMAASFIWRKKSKRLMVIAFGLLMVFGNSFLLHEVNLMWEHPITLDEQLEHHQIGVVLGGYAYHSPENNRVTFRQSSDRLLQGMRLLQTGKVNQLILSGGSGYVTLPDSKESEYVGAFLEELHLTNGNILLETESRNTHENATETAKMLQRLQKDKQRIVLITSAYHMPRAISCFEKAGIEVIPFAADPTTGERVFTLDHLLLPRAETFGYWNILLHEWVGYLSYKVLGYA